MKISDGFWMDKKGYDVRYVAQAYQVEMTENEIRVLATPYVVQNRGMTLAGPNLKITYSSRAIEDRHRRMHLWLWRKIYSVCKKRTDRRNVEQRRRNVYRAEL